MTGLTRSLTASPEDATASDLAYEIQVRRKIEEGLWDLDEGRSTPHDEVRERFRAW